MRSLRFRLLLTLLPATLLIWAVSGVVSYKKARHEAEELLEGQLAQSAKLLMAQVHHEQSNNGKLARSPVEGVITGERHPYEQPLEFQVWGKDGVLWLRSSNAPGEPLARQPGYRDISHRGQAWRMLTIWAPGGEFQVQVAQSLADRERVALEVATQVGLPSVLALPLLTLLIYLAVRRAVHPLDLMAESLAARSPDNLEALPENGAAPAEVKPLIHALNHLLRRLHTALDNERRFTADAAHELRTPLAAIKIQSQVALASTEEADRRHALRQVRAGTDRASRLVDQLLRLARLDPLAGLAEAAELKLDELAARLADEMEPLARELGKCVHFVDSPDEVVVRGDAELLSVALRNLLENALRHTPDGCEVTLGASLEQARPVLWVRDTGQGVEEEDLARLTERFYRGRDVTQEGSGLGLAIVRRVAEIHGACLELANHPAGGLVARIRWARNSSLPNS